MKASYDCQRDYAASVKEIVPRAVPFSAALQGCSALFCPYIFGEYDRTGTAMGVVRFFRKQGLLFPRKLQRGIRQGENVWGELGHSRALQVLHNPRYSGTYVYGRHRVDHTGQKKTPIALPLDEWQVVIPDAHPGYISWEQYQRNLKRLRECSQAYGHDRRNSPPGEGPALLQGLAVCGLCGQRMTLRYHTRVDRQVPTYVCQRVGIEQATPICQSIPGQTLDETIGQLLLELMTPLTLDVALAVQQELEQRLVEVDRLRQQHVERLKYAADIARQRYMQVDPGNRLVADTLEADWNQALRDLTTAQEDDEQQSASDRSRLDEDARQKVRALASDFPRIWNDPDTPDQQRKRMVRLLIEDVTRVKGSSIQAQVRFRGGATRTLEIDKPQNAGEIRKTKPQVIEEIGRLLDDYTAGQIATILNEEGRTSGEGRPFTARIVQSLCRNYDLKSRYDRLREQGLLTADEMADALQVSHHTVRIWRREGLLQGYPYTDKPECLYDPPDAHSPRKSQGEKFSERRRFPSLTPQRPHEVQHAT